MHNQTEVVMEDKTEPSENQKENIRDAKGRFLPGYTPETAFKPGQSGNLAGRPPNELSITNLLRQKLDEVPTEILGKPYTGGKTWLELITEAALTAAAFGDSAPLKVILDRLEGPITQVISASVELEQYKSANELLLALLSNRRGSTEGSDADKGEEESEDNAESEGHTRTGVHGSDGGVHKTAPPPGYTG